MIIELPICQYLGPLLHERFSQKPQNPCSGHLIEGYYLNTAVRQMTWTKFKYLVSVSALLNLVLVHFILFVDTVQCTVHALVRISTVTHTMYSCTQVHRYLVNVVPRYIARRSKVLYIKLQQDSQACSQASFENYILGIQYWIFTFEILEQKTYFRQSDQIVKKQTIQAKQHVYTQITIYKYNMIISGSLVILLYRSTDQMCTCERRSIFGWGGLGAPQA